MLIDNLVKHQECIEALVAMIPAKHYLTQQQQDPSQYVYNKKNKAPKQLVKEASKKAKRFNLDPDQAKTVAAIQAEQLTTITPPTTPNNNALASTYTELQERVRNRIMAERAKRCCDAEQPMSRQDIIEKRKEKKQQRKEAIKKNKERISSTSSIPSQSSSTTTLSADPETIESVPVNVSFGAIDFGLQTDQRKSKADIHGQLKKAEAHKEALDKLRLTDADKAAQVEETQTWDKMLQLAQGSKVKDDIQLLKKTVKRKEAEKKKSSGTWKSRQESLQKDIDARQKKRRDNLNARVEDKKSRKMGKKKSSKRPGFEGGRKK